jgi:hypothetical protein
MDGRILISLISGLIRVFERQNTGLCKVKRFVEPNRSDILNDLIS